MNEVVTRFLARAALLALVLIVVLQFALLIRISRPERLALARTARALACPSGEFLAFRGAPDATELKFLGAIESHVPVGETVVFTARRGDIGSLAYYKLGYWLSPRYSYVVLVHDSTPRESDLIAELGKARAEWFCVIDDADMLDSVLGRGHQAHFALLHLNGGALDVVAAF